MSDAPVRSKDEPAAGAVFGVVVPTIGRVEQLRELLESVWGQGFESVVVSVCAQRNQDAVEAVVEDFRRTSGMTVHFVTGSTPGVAGGRNAAVAAITERVEYLLFPNDTSRLPAGLLTDLRAGLRGGAAAAVTVTEGHGVKFTLPPEGAPLDRRSVWLVISPGLVLHRGTFDDLGGFDDTLGTGAPTPWQSGEETDLLLRYLEAHGDRGFRWLGDLRVEGVPDSAGLTREQRRRKLRAYARGYGRVLSRHRYGLVWKARALVAGVTFGLRRREQFEPLDGWWVFLGRFEGLLGVVLGRTKTTNAVNR